MEALDRKIRDALLNLKTDLLGSLLKQVPGKNEDKWKWLSEKNLWEVDVNENCTVGDDAAEKQVQCLVNKGHMTYLNLDNDDETDPPAVYTARMDVCEGFLVVKISDMSGVEIYLGHP